MKRFLMLALAGAVWMTSLTGCTSKEPEPVKKPTSFFSSDRMPKKPK